MIRYLNIGRNLNLPKMISVAEELRPVPMHYPDWLCQSLCFHFSKNGGQTEIMTHEEIIIECHLCGARERVW